MMNLYDCFINDLSHCCKISVKLPEPFMSGKAYIAIDFNSATMYMSAYFQDDHDLDYYKKFIDYIVMNPEQHTNGAITLPSARLSSGRHITIGSGSRISISSKYYTDDVEENINNFTLSSRIFIYAKTGLNSSDLKSLIAYGNSQTVSRKIKFLSLQYLEDIILYDNPIAFISHDSKDKDEIARIIAENLSRKRISVWYDEYALKPGDSLSESIDNGIKKCTKCILVISPNFINNNGWTKKEFRSIITKEIIENQKVIIPIWANVTYQDVYNYNAELADTFAIKWDQGADNVCSTLAQQLLQ